MSQIIPKNVPHGVGQKTSPKFAAHLNRHSAALTPDAARLKEFEQVNFQLASQLDASLATNRDRLINGVSPATKVPFKWLTESPLDDINRYVDRRVKDYSNTPLTAEKRTGSHKTNTFFDFDTDEKPLKL